MSIPELPTVPCVYCGTPTTYTGTQHCDPCHGATKAPMETLLKILLENQYLAECDAGTYERLVPAKSQVDAL